MLITLWSDYVLYVFSLGLLLWILSVIKQSDKRRQWANFIAQPSALFAVVILLCYLSIGLLDSLHFRPNLEEEKFANNGMLSALDKLLLPLIKGAEKSYSAPFATHALSKEAVLHEGKVAWQYPRLVFGGAHLVQESDKKQDIMQRLWQMFIASGLYIALIVGLLRLLKLPCSKLGYLLISLGIIIWQFLHYFMAYYHIFGTNQVGEDVFYQSVKSIRTGLIIGCFSSILTLPLAILFGLLAGYYKSWVDDLVQYVYTTLSSIPGVLLIAAAVLILDSLMGQHAEWFSTAAHRSDLRLLALCAILGLTGWTSLCRLIRAETFKLSEMEYILAARALGSSTLTIMFKHLVPNLAHIILIVLVLDFSGLVLTEAVLSYVGVGVDSASYSWGLMINSARFELARTPVVWWSIAAAFSMMFFLVVAANILADLLREAFDPRAKR